MFSSLWQRVFRAMHLQVFLYDTFRRHAHTYIEPAIVTKWKASQDDMLLRLSRENAIIGGDMRADSPGHSAKFGSYTVMDLKTNTVIDVQLVQSNEVGGSYHMEKEGLKRSLALLNGRKVTLDCIVTDRHPQIQKFLREAGINQYYDVWHMEKGLSKQLEKISKIKNKRLPEAEEVDAGHKKSHLLDCGNICVRTREGGKMDLHPQPCPGRPHPRGLQFPSLSASSSQNPRQEQMADNRNSSVLPAGEDSTWLLCITMRMLHETRPPHPLGTLSTGCISQSTGRESAG
ncbi:uncharacterized protein LOC143105675 [Alosa pseudoharengus]|uniref:uncharacterized protein LOC143105675 n=1 Tax=Alosa pseudoharengus TaxID=34774 RepID=UPI003F8B1E14